MQTHFFDALTLGEQAALAAHVVQSQPPLAADGPPSPFSVGFGLVVSARTAPCCPELQAREKQAVNQSNQSAFTRKSRPSAPAESQPPQPRREQSALQSRPESARRSSLRSRPARYYLVPAQRRAARRGASNARARPARSLYSPTRRREVAAQERRDERFPSD